MKLLQKLKSLGALGSALLMLGLSTPAFADMGAEAKSAKGVDKAKHAPVDEASEFTVGTKVYVWSKISDAKDKSVSHVWKKDGKEIKRYTFTIKGAVSYRYSNMPFATAGSYSVEIQGPDGTVLTTASFTVK